MNAEDNLEEFADPANYDREESPGSKRRIAFHVDRVTQIGGPVLDLACGTGLVALPIAERGLAVTGLDLCLPMLEHARAKALSAGLHIDWVQADARDFDLGRSFRCIVLTGHAFQAFLTRGDQVRMLASVRRHLAPDGVFVFDTRNPTGHDLQAPPVEAFWHHFTDVQGHTVTVSGRQVFDPLLQVLLWTTWRRWNDGAREHMTRTRISCRFTYPQELAVLLRDQGFGIVEQLGDWDGSPVRADREELITFCRLR